MTRIIKFTNIRRLMAVVSIGVILAGLAATVARGGFNLGIDFTGGVNKQFQVVPEAFAVSYVGPGTALFNVAGGAATLSLSGVAEEKNLVFDFDAYARVQDLGTALGFIDGVTVDLAASTAGLSTSLILPLNFPVTLGETPQTVNRLLGEREELFAPIEKVRDALSGLERFSLQVVGRAREQQFVLKMPVPADASGNNQFLEEVDNKIIDSLTADFGAGTVILKRTDFVGRAFTSDLIRGAYWAIIVALFLILVYITVRFRFVYAAGAILALLHDVAVMLGVIGALGVEVTSATIAAVLTIIGYSLNDTIVVFDRVRENYTLMQEADRATVINTSITQSLSRTIITSLTTLLAIIAIYVFGTGAIKDFAFNLIIGVVVGTYSSIFVASPTVMVWQDAIERHRRKREIRSHVVSVGASGKTPAKSIVAKETESAADKVAVSSAVESPARQRSNKKKKRKRR